MRWRLFWRTCKILETYAKGDSSASELEPDNLFFVGVFKTDDVSVSGTCRKTLPAVHATTINQQPTAVI